jgi:hypothetical protein
MRLVKVILHTIDAVRMAMSVLDDARHVAEEVFAAVALGNTSPFFRGKHDMVRGGGVGDMSRFYAGRPRSGLRLVAGWFSVG